MRVIHILVDLPRYCEHAFLSNPTWCQNFRRTSTAMANYNVPLQPPGAFRFDNPDEWAKWKCRFEQFRLASGLSKEFEERQVCTLLYTLGEDSEDVLSSTNISEDDRKKYAEVMAKLDGFFQVGKNIIYERARFNRRVQQADESVEQFITNLYQLAKYCEYGNLRDEMISDRIVVGIREQPDPDLTLDKAKKIVRQREAVHEHQQFLLGKSIEGTMVEAVSKGKRQQLCTRCGKGATHPRQACPAREAICHKCSKKGHYNSVCHSKFVAMISEV